MSDFFGSIETRGKTHEDMESITHARLDDSMTTVEWSDLNERTPSLNENRPYLHESLL